MRVLVVEDQAMVRGAISQLLSFEEEIEVIGQAEDGQAAYEFLSNLSDVEQQQVDIVLTDIEMPKVSGLELAEKVMASHPHINVVIMTTFSKSGYIKRAMNLGVKAFILKEAPTDELVDALRQVKQGKKVINSELALMALDDNDPLSDKERKAIKLAGEGLKTAEIAKALFLSEGTIRNYLSEAISKLNATNRIEAARIAKQKGWI